MTEKTLFVIAFVGRQGSSYVQGLIDSHPDAVCAGEIFSPAASKRGWRAWMKGEPKPFIHSGEKEVSRYLQRQINSRDAKAVGFKLPLYSMLEHPDIVPALHRFGYKAIRVTRDNLLDQYISMRLAQVNNAWTSEQGQINTTRFPGDIADAERRFAEWEQENADTAAAIERLPSIDFIYERGESQMPAVLDFLGLRQLPLESRFKRQRTGTQADALENYAEMKFHFAGTKWARFFEV